MENQQDEFHIKDTSATRRIFDLKKRIRAVTGGTAASKTISILIWLLITVNHKKIKTNSQLLCQSHIPILKKEP